MYAGGMVRAPVAKIRCMIADFSGSPGTIGVTPRLGGLQRLVAKIEAKPGHARALIGSVAAEAGVRHDRPDVAIETDFTAEPRQGKGRTQPTQGRVNC